MATELDLLMSALKELGMKHILERLLTQTINLLLQCMLDLKCLIKIWNVYNKQINLSIMVNVLNNRIF